MHVSRATVCNVTKDKRRVGKKNKRIGRSLSEQASSVHGRVSQRRRTSHSHSAEASFSSQAGERTAARKRAASCSRSSRRVTSAQRKAAQRTTVQSSASQGITPQSRAVPRIGKQRRDTQRGALQRKTSNAQLHQRQSVRRSRTALSREQIETRKKYNMLLLKAIIWIAIIALVIIAVAFVGSTIRDSIDKIDAVTAQPDPADEYREIACTAELIKPTMTAAVTYAGKPVDFTATLTNQGKKRPCYLDSGYATMHLTVKSGDELIWDSQVCTLGDKSRQLLIGAQREGTFAAQWEGKVAGASCTGTTLSQPGTYRAQLYWNDQALGDEYVFELKEEPKPEPQPEPESKDG